MLQRKAILRAFESSFELFLRHDDSCIVEKECFAMRDVMKQLIELIVVCKDIGLDDAVVKCGWIFWIGSYERISKCCTQ